MGDDHGNDDQAEPGSRRQRITIGVEKVLYLAATDHNFRAVLRRDRREALRQWNLTLSSTEKAVLYTVDQRNLDALIAAARPASEKRRRFMAAVGGAVAASASGLIITASYGCTKGVRPKPSEQPQPRPVTDAGSPKPHTNNPNVDEGTPPLSTSPTLDAGAGNDK